MCKYRAGVVCGKGRDLDNQSACRFKEGSLERQSLASCRAGSEVTCRHLAVTDLIRTGICGSYSAGPSVRPICTRCCFAMTNMIRVCSKFY